MSSEDDSAKLARMIVALYDDLYDELEDEEEDEE